MSDHDDDEFDEETLIEQMRGGQDDLLKQLSAVDEETLLKQLSAVDEETLIEQMRGGQDRQAALLELLAEEEDLP